MTNAATKWADARRREVITKIESMQRNGPASISQLQWADCELLLAALRAAPAAEIPREPTQAMIDAAFVVYDGMRPGSFSAEMTRMWRAMHDAAINGPAACKTLPSSQEEAGRAGIAGSGAARDGSSADIRASAAAIRKRVDAEVAMFERAGSGAAPIGGLAGPYQGVADYICAEIRGLQSALTAERERSARLEAALKIAQTAVDDWLHSYASELCNEADVDATRARLSEGGTLYYIAGVAQAIRAALTPTAKEQT